jgi:threonyl-tRNA synthetase
MLNSDNCAIVFLNFDDPDGKNTVWRSSMMILGGTCETHFASEPCDGYTTKDGFFYEIGMLGDVSSGKNVVLESDHSIITEKATKFIAQRLPFERLDILKTDMLEMFKVL